MPRGQDTFITTLPDGSVLFNFTGAVHAQGLDLDAGTSVTPPSEDRVRWIRTSDGAVVADLAAYETGGSGLTLRSIAVGGSGQASSQLAAVSGAQAIALGARIFGASEEITAAVTSGAQRTILNQAGRSDFVRAGAVGSLMVISGRCTTATATLNTQSPGISGVVRNAAGNITITHTAWPSGAAVPISFAGSATTPGLFFAMIGSSNTTTNIVAVTGAGVNTDCVFDFTITGG